MDETRDEWKYGIVAIPRDEVENLKDNPDLHVIHAVGFECEPTFETYILLYDELFDLIDEAFYLAPASPDMMEDIINNPESIQISHEDF